MESSSAAEEQAPQPKKPYSSPQLIEHGKIEDITGAIISHSGPFF